MPLSSVVTALLTASTPSKRVPLMIPLSLAGKGKSHTEQYQVNRGLFQELPDAQGVVSRCIVVVKQP